MHQVDQTDGHIIPRCPLGVSTAELLHSADLLPNPIGLVVQEEN